MSVQPNESLIVKVIHRYHPEWEPPKDTGQLWVRTLCPFHVEERPSAAVSYELDAFCCLACGVKGSVLSLIKKQEEVSYATAERIAQELSAGSDKPVSPKPPRKPRRRVFGLKGTDQSKNPRAGRAVSSGIRGRSTPWS